MPGSVAALGADFLLRKQGFTASQRRSFRAGAVGIGAARTTSLEGALSRPALEQAAISGLT